MDNETARDILSSYRSSGADARDATFLEALEQAERDPDTKWWFREQQVFDRQVSALMRELPSPPNGRERLLSMLAIESGETVQKPVGGGPWKAGLSVAAALALILGIAAFMNDRDNYPAPFITSSEDFSLSQLARNSMPLEFRGDTTGALVHWLAQREAPVPDVLPRPFEKAMANGCKIYSIDNGGSISLLCFEVDGELLHLFVFDEVARALLDVAPRQWWREGDWNMMAYDNGKQLVALVSKANTEKIDQMISG